jgi:hypothetical protein
MPEVPGQPYEPYPTVEPQVEMLRPIGIPQVPDAFGAATAHAIATFGGDIDKAATDVFKGAVEIKKRQIDQQVRDQLTATTNQVAPLQEKFLTLEGNNAVNQMPEHLVALDQARLSGRAALEQAGVGSYGIDKYDAEYGAYQRNYVQRAISHSAQQNVKAQDNSLSARVDSMENNVQSTPMDDATFNTAMQDRRKLEYERAQLRGLDANSAKVAGDDAVSRLTQRRIIGMAVRGDDQGAQDMLAAAVANKTLVGKAADDTQRQIQTQVQRNFSYGRAVEAEARRSENAAVATDANKIYQRNVTADDQGNLIVNPAFLPQAAALTGTHPAAENARPTETAMISWFNAKREQAEKPRRAVSSPEVLDNFNARLFDPDNPLTLVQTLQAESDALRGRPGIDEKQGNLFRQIISARDQGSLKDPILKDTLAAVKNKLSWEALNSDDIGGAEAYARFARAFYPGYIALSQAGHGMAVGALNMDDPNSLVNVALAAARNAPTLQDRLRPLPPQADLTPPPAAQAAAPSPQRAGVEPRTPGETFADWLVRTGRAAPMPSPPQSR